MSKSSFLQNQLFWIATRYLLPGNVVSEIDAVSRNVSIFTCVKMPLICNSMKQSTLLFHPWNHKADYMNGHLQDITDCIQELPQSSMVCIPSWVWRGKGYCMPVKSIQSRFYSVKLYHKKAFWYNFWAWAKLVLFITTFGIVRQVAQSV
jgi:hypothetical protein